MPIIKTYLKSGQVFETVGRVNVTRGALGIKSADWTDIKSGERVIYASAEDIVAITEVIEAVAAE